MLRRSLPLQGSRTRGPSRRYSFVASSLSGGGGSSSRSSGGAAAAEDAAPATPLSSLMSSALLTTSSSPPQGASIGLAATPLSLSPVRLRRSLSMASLLRPIEDASSRELLEQVISHVSLPAPQLAAIARSMAASMAAGLESGSGGGSDGGGGSCAAAAAGVPLMLPTATDCLPDGHERGEYFALEFGGGPLMRLLRVRFAEDRRHETSSVDLEEVEVPVERLRAAPADALFEFLAARALEFVERTRKRSSFSSTSSPPSPSSSSSLSSLSPFSPTPPPPPPVFGFCFSFPIDQAAHPTDPSGGTLVRWAKGWACEPGGVGCEPARMLEAAAKRVEAARREERQSTAGRDDAPSSSSSSPVSLNPSPPPLVVAALANDTVATLAAARYSDGGDAALSLVLNQGTNAAYVESLSNVDRLCAAEALRSRGWAPRSPEVVVDVEWPAFDDALLPALPDDVGGNGSRNRTEEEEEEEEEAKSSESRADGGEAAAEEEEDSIRASSRVFESLTAPMCLGEAARRLLVRLGDAGGWFSDSCGGGGGSGGGGGGGGEEGDKGANGRTVVVGGGNVSSTFSPPPPPPPPPPLWRVRGSLDAVSVARVAADTSPDARYAAEELASAFCRSCPGSGGSPPPSSSSHAAFLRFLECNRDARVQCRDACSALLRRSARLTAAGLAGVLIHREETGAAQAPAGSAPCSPLEPRRRAEDAAAAVAAASSSPSPSPPSSQLPPAASRRTIVAVDGPFFRRGGLFVDELRSALSETLVAVHASSSSSPSSTPPPLVSLTVPDGGAALGAAALAAAAHNAAQAMGAQDLGQATTEGRFLKFPPRRAAAASSPSSQPKR